MANLVGTRKRQSDVLNQVRANSLALVKLLTLMREMKLAKDNGFIGIDPSNNPGDPQSYLDANAQALGYGDAAIAQSAFNDALDACANMYNSGDFQNLVRACGFYEQTREQ
jgi:hypothetical protein